MKPIKYLAAVSVFALLLAGCASNKQDDVSVSESADAYGIEIDEEDGVEDVYENSEKKEITVQKKKKDKVGFFESFTIAKYLDLSEGSVFTSKYFGGLKQSECVYVYAQKNDMSGFGANYQGAYYYVLLDDANKKILDSCFKKYFSDFENKKLQRDNKKSYKAYGKIKVRLNWGGAKSSCSYYANNVVATVGYEFKENSPYFTIQMLSAVDESKMGLGDGTDIVYSSNLEYFLTKNQCKALSEGISDEVIEKARNPVNENFIEDEETFTGDNY